MMQTARLLFEKFEIGGDPATAGPSAEWVAGHAAGLAEGHAAAQDAARHDQSRLQSDLVQAVSDMTFVYAEAEQAVLRSLIPLFSGICAHLLPGMEQAALAAHLVEHLRALARDICPGQIILRVAPAELEAVSNALNGDLRDAVTVTADPALAPGTANWSAGDVTRQIDITAAFAQIQDTLRATLHEIERKDANGAQ